jgi:ubiquinone/menaquinone biosynthesis C-methylase UbiE
MESRIVLRSALRSIDSDVAHPMEKRSPPDQSDRISGFFQGTEMPDPEWWQALWSDPARVLSDAGLTAGNLAVDLCAGDGWFTLPMARIARHVIAVDIDSVLLGRARQRLSQANLTNCHFKVGDAFDLAKLVTEPVDIVFLANAFHGVPDQTGLSAVVARVLRPGGRFAIVNWHQRPREETVVLGQPRGPRTELRMTPDAVNAVVEPCGLSLRYVADIAPYHYVCVFERLRDGQG